MSHPLVVLPTYNEAATVEGVVAGALAAHPELEVLVVDDASPDGTGRLAEGLAAVQPRVNVIHRSAKKGLGPAYRAGFARGLLAEPAVLCAMDADGSHDPADLTRLLAATDGADVVIGSRYVPGGEVTAWPAHRRLLSRGANRYTRAATGLHVADATSGFRAYRRPVVETVGLDMHSDGYAFQVEMALRAWRAGFRVVEIPIVFTERRDGRSKISRHIVAEAAWRVTRWGLTGPRGPAGVHPRSVAA